MMSFKSRTPGDHRTIDAQLFREVMNRPSIARELFLPIDQAWWDGGRYTLGRWISKTPPPRLTGVRLQEPRSGESGHLSEKDTQNDLSSLVRSVTELRGVPELSGLVLSDETLVGQQSGKIPGKRLIFGLRYPSDIGLKGESAAAEECHRVLRRAIDKAGFVVEHPKTPFDPASGFTGLLEWTDSVRLRRKKLDRRWLLLLLLLPLLLIPWSCLWSPSTPATLFGVAGEEESILILLDKSGSMGPYIAQVRDEARKLLEERSRDTTKRHYVDLIVYDAETESVLGGLQPVTSDGIARITSYLDKMTVGGWTRLSVALKLAAQEVVKHGRKTTVIVLTDAEDKTIPQLIRDKDRVRASFGRVPVTINATTPRLFNGGNPTPINADEQDLAELCRIFNGRFGPSRAVP